MSKLKAKPRYYRKIGVFYTKITAPDGHVSYSEPSSAIPLDGRLDDRRLHLRALGEAERGGFDGYRVARGYLSDPFILTAAVIPVEKDENGMAIMPACNHRR